ncbi:MAG: hypothetical protein EOP51_17320 [Sphingobacteriales bacterium]|nr:MAG: hypothetical protein EOP51_17320 [Sphingobacteriales bacterium]
MKKRTSLYFQTNKARKVIENPMTSDLATFLSASMQLTRSNVVRRHIEESLIELGANWQMTAQNQYKLSA